jgi:hypothetical protein
MANLPDSTGLHFTAGWFFSQVMQITFTIFLFSSKAGQY